MTRRGWTDQERQDAVTLDWEAFTQAYPDRSLEAYLRQQRRARAAEGSQPVAPVKTVTSPMPDPNEDEWEELFSSLERADRARKYLSPTEETTHVSLSGPVAIAFMSDVHIGAGGVDYARFRADLDLIRETPDLYFLINGDLLENAKPQMKSGNALYHSLFSSPREQVAYARSRLTPVRDKLLVLTQGNHDARDGMMAGIDRLPDIAKELQAPYFTEKGGTIYLNVDGQDYVIVVKHQYGGQSKITKSNSARRLWTEWPNSWESADVVALAHLHEPDLYLTQQRGQDVVWLRGGTYKVHDEWAESKGYKPTYGVPTVVFMPGERKMVPFASMEDAVAFMEAIRKAA